MKNSFYNKVYLVYLSLIIALEHLQNSDITLTYHIHISVFILCTWYVYAMFMVKGKDSLTIANHRTRCQVYNTNFSNNFLLILENFC